MVKEIKMKDKEFACVVHTFQKTFFEEKEEDFPELRQLFEFIDANFEKFRTIENIKLILPVLHFCLQFAATTDNENLDYINGYLLSWLIKSKKSEAYLDLLSAALQVIYLVLSMPQVAKKLSSNESLSNVLLELLLANSSKALNAKILSCLQLYSHLYALGEKLIRQIWSILMPETGLQNVPENSTQILVHLFDDFAYYNKRIAYNNQIINTIQNGLLSAVREERRSAYYLIKKVVNVTITNYKTDPEYEIYNIDAFKRFWTVYITILENLDENQSHLIMPALVALKSIEQQAVVPKDWKNWKRILHTKLLSNNNILVCRWVLEYSLQTWNCGDLNADILGLFLNALNNTNLYNEENYFLPTTNIEQFIKTGQQLPFFLECFTNVNWKSVPLHFWLSQLDLYWNHNQTKTISKEMLLSLASRVRVLQNPLIRRECIKIFGHIFATSIEKLDLQDYIKFVETLYNVLDAYSNFKLFSDKLAQSNTSFETGSICKFTKRFYEILTNNLYTNSNKEEEIGQLLEIILSFLYKVPKSYHGWLRFMIVFDVKRSVKITKFCQKMYDIDFYALINSTLEEIQEEFHQKLVFDLSQRDEETCIRQKANDFYICEIIKQFTEITALQIKLDDLLDTGSYRSLYRLSELLASYQEEEVNSNIFIPSIKKYLKIDSDCNEVIANLLKHKLTSEIAETMLKIDLENWGVCTAVLNSITDRHLKLSQDCVLQGLLIGETKTGNARIEELYECKLLKILPKAMKIRCKYASQSQFLTEIMTFNEQLAQKKQKYHENSKEHRIKMRIVRYIAYVIGNCVGCASSENHLDRLWEVLMTQVNHPNVTFAYEVLTAILINSLEFITSKLKQFNKYSFRQLLSVISVTNIYCCRNEENLRGTLEQRDIVLALLPLTMVSEFKVRLFAQQVIYNILNQTLGNNEEDKFEMHKLINVIKATVGIHITDFKIDLRLQLYRLCDQLDWIDIIMYVTDAPYDEYCWTRDFSNYEQMKIRYRSKYINTMQNCKSKEQNFVIDNAQIQRKLNPTNDILIDHKFIKYPECIGKEMYIVGTLVTKLSNLGGIARTCEVFGIKNLVVSCAKLIAEPEFKSVSMTAEQGLDITEVKSTNLVQFLLQKYCEGFRIVGADQSSSYTSSLLNFEFPKKCVLVVGSEECGLPPDVIEFCSSVLKIPHFGNISTLNTHISSAVIVWEYCKQHMKLKL